VTSAPVIGVCAPLERARWAVWDMPADPALVDDPGSVLARIDGLLLLGGADIAADRYGQVPHPDSETPQHVRDAVEIALVQAAHTMDLPTLGICRGLQVINVALGGTLRQHLPGELDTDMHRREIGRFDGNEHDVRLAPGSLAATATGAELHRVVSHHHQAVGALAVGLVASGAS
jgi:putative glutamine amidotransferase